jgi:hypothetical protein
LSARRTNRSRQKQRPPSAEIARIIAAIQIDKVANNYDVAVNIGRDAALCFGDAKLNERRDLKRETTADLPRRIDAHKKRGRNNV